MIQAECWKVAPICLSIQFHAQSFKPFAGLSKERDEGSAIAGHWCFALLLSDQRLNIEMCIVEMFVSEIYGSSKSSRHFNSPRILVLEETSYQSPLSFQSDQDIMDRWTSP